VLERDAQRTKSLLEKAGAKVVGTVLNRFRDRYGPQPYPYGADYVSK
jgi:Mrp family chromosome partitioning ATPase